MYNKPNIDIGKRFARVLILGFIVYYIIWFGIISCFNRYQYRLRHFFKCLIYLDIIATCVFYGGIFNSIWAFVHGKFNK